MIKGQKKSVGVRMPLDMYEQVREQAEKGSRTIPSYIRQVLKRYLWHVENAPETLTGEWKM